jgi:hypothetical protein
MRKIPLLTLGLSLSISLLTFSTSLLAEKAEATTQSGQNEYLDWRLLSVSHRTDKKTLRAILGNEIAIAAARKGNNKPWPDGSILAKVVWKQRTHPNWPAAIVPEEFAAAEAMIKDSQKYASTGGWGFAHWKKGKLEMHSEEKAKSCFGCHAPMKDQDYVYTFTLPMTQK